jgi:hypothetical protein
MGAILVKALEALDAEPDLTITAYARETLADVLTFGVCLA